MKPERKPVSILAFANKKDETYFFKSSFVFVTILIGSNVYNVSFTGGCNGNLKAISKLVDGMSKEDIIKKCRGITCGLKKTSCSDQLVKALEQIK